MLRLETERRMQAERPTYVVRLQAQAGVDAVRGLRWILKVSLRQFGLKCIDIHVEDEPPASRPQLVK
jgi:hypothetical protein